MPSPLGHALAGIGTGLLVAGRGDRGGQRPSWPSSPARLALFFAAVACAPDLDLLIGNHNGPTHSVGAAAIVGFVVFAWTRHPRIATAAAFAYGSHVLLDWFNQDDSPPLGVMALWPFSREHFISPWPLLPPISRRYWLPGFWTHTLKVALFELALFGTFAASSYFYRVRRHGRTLRAGTEEMKNRREVG